MPIPFDPTCGGFSLANAYFLAKASLAAYSIGADLKTPLDELGLAALPASSGAKDIDYFVGFTDTFSVLSFRGTVVKSVHDWLTDATIEQVKDQFGTGLVHEGFSDAVTAVWPGVLEALKQQPVAGRPLFVTGHSLGGGMATLAAQWLAANGLAVQGTYTYGSPRVGNIAFYRNYLPVNYRFVNNSDIVPHVPFEVGALGWEVLFYKHIGTLQYLDRHGNLNDGMSDWQEKKEFMINEVATVAGQWDACFADHAIAKYIAAIGQNAPLNIKPQ